jgi:hypothetical protein
MAINTVKTKDKVMRSINKKILKLNSRNGDQSQKNRRQHQDKLAFLRKKNQSQKSKKLPDKKLERQQRRLLQRVMAINIVKTIDKVMRSTNKKSFKFHRRNGEQGQKKRRKQQDKLTILILMIKLPKWKKLLEKNLKR